MSQRVLVTGGSGFVGSSLALAMKRDHPEWRVTSLDNLKRRGSELILNRLRAGGVDFLHGDIRQPEDLAAAGPCDLLVECSAEPSVHAGYGASPAYLVNTNLVGTLNCLEHCRVHGATVVFLSSSRIYPIAGLCALPLVNEGDRLVLGQEAAGRGWSRAGIAEDFPLEGSRSLYGATKLASELILEEYRAMYGLKAVINRCGVLAGPWQMGKVDQGFMVLWAARHSYGGALSYMGFGGKGHQVRDVLHVDDLYDLVMMQLADIGRHDGVVYNVGGGAAISTSLAELTGLCQRVTGRTIAIGETPETRAADVPWYISDCAKVTAATGWRSRRSLEHIVEDVSVWLRDNRPMLEPILGA